MMKKNDEVKTDKAKRRKIDKEVELIRRIRTKLGTGDEKEKKVMRRI